MYPKGTINEPDPDMPPLLQDLHYMAQKIESLETGVEKIDQFLMIKDRVNQSVQNRLENLEGYMEMEDRVTACDVLFRLTELEKFKDEQSQLEIRFHKIQESIDCLFTCIKGLEGREGIRSLQQSCNHKTPHKCLACNGEGKKPIPPSENIMYTVMGGQSLTVDALGNHFLGCVTCKGEGIVWG